MTAICIIPARGGSRRIPGKNTRDFRGKPIIAYSIDMALKTGLFSQVVVSTDSRAIEMVAHAYGARVVQRPAHLSIDSVGTQAVAAYTLQDIQATEDYCCVIYPTAPLMTVEDLHLGFERLRESHAPYCYTVGPDWQDAGQWYWGRRFDFIAGTPLDQSALYQLPASRTCDINTEDDWQLALQLYDHMHGGSNG